MFLACEKAAGVHTKHFMLRVLARIPMVGLMWLIALAVPFLGPINSVIGAFGVAIGMYSIPAFVFILTYRTRFARQVRHPEYTQILDLRCRCFHTCGIVILERKHVIRPIQDKETCFPCVQNSAVKLPPFLPSWTLMFILNGSIVVWCLVVGVGFGGWASIENLVKQINTFGFFDNCYQCPKSK